jgi:NADPH-dependent curcumin reductase CurA
MRAYAVGEVTASDQSRYPVGTRVVGPFGMKTWHASDGSDIRRVVPADLEPLEASLGVVGHIGLTAHIGLRRIAAAKAGETVVVTSAAGAVGGVAAQIARHLGCRVIGLASRSKVPWASNTYGIETMLDRADPDLEARLEDAAPDGVDVFFDNTGGTVHDLIMTRMATGGRVVICGTIAVDSAQPGTGPRHERLILDRELTVTGFLQSHLDGEADQALAELREWHDAGLVRLHYEQIAGLEHAPVALERLLTGNHRGKVIITTDPDHDIDT